MKHTLLSPSAIQGSNQRWAGWKHHIPDIQKVENYYKNKTSLQPVLRTGQWGMMLDGWGGGGLSKEDM